MLHRRVVLVALLLAGVLAVSYSASAGVAGKSPPKRFKTIAIGYSGPFGQIKAGSGWGYELNLQNNGHKPMTAARIDIYLPQQKISSGSIRLGGLKLSAARGTLVGHHLWWTARNLLPSWGTEIDLSVHVLPNAKGMICDRLLVTYNHAVGDYSPPCIKVVGLG